MACLFPEWGLSSRRGADQSTLAADDDEEETFSDTKRSLKAQLQFGAVGQTHSEMRESLRSSKDYEHMLGVGLLRSHASSDLVPPALRKQLKIFDRKVQCLDGIVKNLRSVVRLQSLHSNMAEMCDTLEDYAVTENSSAGTSPLAGVASTLCTIAESDAETSALLQDLMYQLDSLLQFDVSRMIRTVVCANEAREALSQAQAKAASGALDDPRRRATVQETLDGRQAAYSRMCASLLVEIPKLIQKLDTTLDKGVAAYVKVRHQCTSFAMHQMTEIEMEVLKIEASAGPRTGVDTMVLMLQDKPRTCDPRLPLVQFVASPGFGAASAILECVSEMALPSDADTVPLSLVSILDDLCLSSDFLRMHILQEALRSSQQSAAPAFRASGVANRILTVVFQLGCADYLKHTLDPLFALIQGNRLHPNATLRGNNILPADIEQCIQATQAALSLICRSALNAPLILRSACAFVAECIGDGDRGRARFAVGGALLLCGFVPAISSPERFGLVSSMTDLSEGTRRVLRGVGRCMCLLANGFRAVGSDVLLQAAQPVLQTAMPDYLEWLDRMIVSPSDPSTDLPGIQVPVCLMKTQGEDVSIVAKFVEKHAHRIRRVLIKSGMKTDLGIFKSLLNARKHGGGLESCTKVDPSLVILANRPQLQPSSLPVWGTPVEVSKRRTRRQHGRKDRNGNAARRSVNSSIGPSPSHLQPKSHTPSVLKPISLEGSAVPRAADSNVAVESEKHGVGIELEGSSSGRLKVRRLVPGSSAERSGQVSVGDEVIMIDGIDILQLHNPLSASPSLIFGPIGSCVSIRLRSSGTDAQRDVSLQRGPPFDPSQGNSVTGTSSDRKIDTATQAEVASSYLLPPLSVPAARTRLISAGQVQGGQSDLPPPTRDVTSRLPITVGVDDSPMFSESDRVRFAAGTVTTDGHGGGVKRRRSVGMSFSLQKDGSYVIKRIKATTTAQGLAVGDLLLSVDGTPVHGLDKTEVSNMLFGQEGTSATLMFRDHTGNDVSHVLFRGKTKGSTIDNPGNDSDSAAVSDCDEIGQSLSTSDEFKSLEIDRPSDVSSNSSADQLPTILLSSFGLEVTRIDEGCLAVVSSSNLNQSQTLCEGDVIVQINGVLLSEVPPTQQKFIVDIDSTTGQPSRLVLGVQSAGAQTVKSIVLDCRIGAATSISGPLDPGVALSSDGVMPDRSIISSAQTGVGPVDEEHIWASSDDGLDGDEDLFTDGDETAFEDEDEDASIEITQPSAKEQHTNDMDQSLPQSSGEGMNLGDNQPSTVPASPEISESALPSTAIMINTDLQQEQDGSTDNESMDKSPRKQSVMDLESSTIIDPDEDAQQIWNAFGVLLKSDGRGYWYISYVSAFYGGLESPPLVGDEIRTCNGLSARGWNLQHFQEHLEDESSTIVLGVQRGLTVCTVNVTLRKAEDPSQKMGEKVGLGFSFSKRDGHWEVSRIFPGSACDGLLHNGDLLEEVNGLRVFGMPGRVLRDILTGAIGSHVTVSVIPNRLNNGQSVSSAAKRRVTDALTHRSDCNACILETEVGTLVSFTMVRALFSQQTIEEADKFVHDVRAGYESDASASNDCMYGIGISFVQDSSGRLFVKRILPGGPAESSGMIQPGDELLAADGIRMSGKPVSQARDAVTGPLGSVVELEIFNTSLENQSRRIFVPRSFAIGGGSSSGWSSMDESDIEHETLASEGDAVPLNVDQNAQSAGQDQESGIPQVQDKLQHERTPQLNDDIEDIPMTPDTINSGSRIHSHSDTESDTQSSVSSSMSDRGRRVGVGVTFRKDSKGRFKIKRVLDDGPAAKSGNVLSGDVVCSVNGQSTSQMDEHDLINAVGGPDGSLCKLLLRRDCGNQQSKNVSVSLTRKSNRRSSQSDLQVVKPQNSTSSVFSEMSAASIMPEKSVLSEPSVSDFGQEQPLAVGGIGLLVRKDGKGNVIVHSIMDDSPASLATVAGGNLLEGDCVRYVNGVSVHGFSATDVLRLMLGPTGTNVTVSFRRAGQPKSLPVDMKRAHSFNPLPLKKKVGVGIVMSKDKQGRFRVKRLEEHSEAAMSRQIESGDVIQSIDDNTISGMTDREVLHLMAGVEGTRVDFCLLRDKKEHNVELIRRRAFTGLSK